MHRAKIDVCRAYKIFTLIGFWKQNLIAYMKQYLETKRNKRNKSEVDERELNEREIKCDYLKMRNIIYAK